MSSLKPNAIKLLQKYNSTRAVTSKENICKNLLCALQKLSDEMKKENILTTKSTQNLHAIQMYEVHQINFKKIFGTELPMRWQHFKRQEIRELGKHHPGFGA